MRLRGIEVQGFKSFPERTKLTFDDGITAIVGPNGSGKSNISDAVRWVFGEQSIKTLRGHKMEDVIFGGTQTRKPQGFAWVSLIIDNSDHTLPVQSAEVIVTRKLYRSGESEYRINNSLVRMRDIVELFLDTGLGRDGYSIIGQGRIAEIVGAKSTQRREIFEEAAGIAKFRMRKTEAERRLTSAEENLVRLRDILGELEGRVEPLRIQSQKASEFLVLAEEKKTLEISLWMQKLEQLQAHIKAQEDKILVCKNDRDSIQNQIDGIEEEVGRIFEEMQSLSVYIENQRASIKGLEESLSHAEADIAVMENDILHSNQDIERIRGEIAGTGLARADMDRQIAEKQAAIDEKKAEHEAALAGLQALAGGIEEKKAEQNRVNSLIDGMKAQRFELHQSISQARMTSASSSSLIEDTLGRIGLLKEASELKDENLARLSRELEECQGYVGELGETILGLENSQKGYAIKLDSRQQRVNELLKEQNGFDQKAGELLQRAQLLSDMERNMEGFGASVKYVMKQSAAGALSGVAGPVSSLLSTDGRYATAIEIALGAAMQNIVVENEGVAKRAISMLVQSKAGRCTFLPISTVRGRRLEEQGLDGQPGFVGIAAGLVRADGRYAGVIDWLLGRVVVAENIDLAVQIAKNHSHRFRIVTLDGQVVNAGGSLTGGYVAKSAGILGRRGEIERLRAEAAGFAAKSREVEERAAAEERELSALKASLMGIEAELRTAREDLVQAQAEHRRLTLTRQEALETHQRAKRDYDELCSRLEELKEKSSSSEEAMAGLTSQLEGIEGELAVKAGRRDELAAAIEEEGERFAQSQLTYMALGKDMELLTGSLELLTRQKEGQHQRLGELEEQIAAHTKAIEEKRQGIEDRREQNAEERRRIDGLYREIEEKNARRLTYEQKSSRLRQREREITNTREQVAAELVRLEERHASMMAEFEAIVGKLWEEYELSRSQAREMAIELADAAAAQRRLTELRNRIRALGSVNLAAIEEYREVSGRYEFLRSQVEDVEKSKAELGKIIGELTEDMCRIFREKFYHINEQFSRIFVELFGGGRARLELADPNDILESGIDIFVQPPGKLIKNLSALSGGEQAFVAIAIYFAILKVSPAPFCLLDEIEAALDDVNVSKFAAYMRRMTKRTQFIAITHRRGTMEEADVLYGVTMQEEGVSKILKLDVGEVESKLGIK